MNAPAVKNQLPFFPHLLGLACFLLSFFLVNFEASAAITVSPSTWNIVGLDSNTPAFGPNRFPVGAKICSTTAASNVVVDFFWDSSNPYVNLRPGSLSQITIPSIAAGACADAFFEVEVDRNAAAFDTTRSYHISAGGASSPVPRELYVEHLISQSRNAISDVRLNGVSVPAGGGMNLVVGNTYTIELAGGTATQGYNQFEAFINFSNTIFQILSVNTTYSADDSPYVPAPNPGLYADACQWDNDPNSPYYLSCAGDYKAGGSNVVTTYVVKILSGGGTTETLNTLLYDFSGSSFHYNADYSTSTRIANIIDPASTNIAKSFSPATTTAGGISTLTFTLTNPNAGAVSGLEFTDVFPTTPAAMTLYDTVTVNTCGGSLTNNLGGALAAGNAGIWLRNATVAANGSCIVQVNITPAAAGTYTNTTQNLLVNSLDTGKSATAALTVSSTPLPPPPPSACAFPQTLATWTMEGPASAPPAYATKAADVSTAAASYTTAAGAQSILNNLGNPNLTYAWGGTAPTTGDGWKETPTSMANYFQFVLDTSKYGGVTISFDGRPDVAGNWANPNSNVYINTSSGGGYTVYNTGVSPFYPQSAKNAWTTFSNIPAAATGTSTTTFRIGVDGSGNNKTNATYYLDNVIFRGCPIPLPPTMTKSFATNPVGVGGTSTLTFTITNPNACCDLSGIAFSDILPLNSLQGTVSVTNGNPTVTGTGTAFRTQLVAGSIIYINKIAYTVSTITSDTALTLTVNYAGATASGLTMASGLTISGAPATTCTGGTASTSIDAATGATVINLSGSSIAAGAGTTCTVTATVKDSIAGPISNVSGAVTSTSSGAVVSPNGIAKASLTAILPPQISKRFAPNPILAGGVSTLTFLVTNPNQNNALNGVAFTDTFPTSPANMIVAAPATYSVSGCGAPTFTPIAGAGSISFTGGTIAAGATCTVTVNVTAATLGSYSNTSGAVSATTAGAGNTASDTLVVSPPHPAIGILKENAASATPAMWGYYLALPVGGNVYYQLSVYNDGDVPLAGVTVTDPNLPVGSISGCAWKDGDNNPAPYPLTLQVANNSNNLDFASCIIGPVSVSSAGTLTNTATASVVYGGVTYTDTDYATYATTGLTLTKSVTQSEYTAAGNTLNYSYLVSNSGFSSLNGPLNVTDDKTAVTCPAISTIGDLDNYFDPGESLTCTASYTITAADVTAKSVTNTASASTPSVGNIAGAASNSSSITSLLAADLSIEKKANNVVSGSTSKPGQEIPYTITVTNTGGAKAKNVILTDTVSPYTAFKLNSFSFTEGSPASGMSLSGCTYKYSYDGGSSWTTTLPADLGGGFNGTVTNWQITFDPALQMNGNNANFTLNYDALVK